MSDIQSSEPSSTEPTSVITQIFQGMHNLEQQVEHLIHPEVVDPAQSVVEQGGPAIPPIESTAVVDSGNVAAAVEGGAPVTGDAVADGGDLPRESHLMLLKSKLAALEAKIGTGALIVKAEFAEILAHIEAVL